MEGQGVIVESTISYKIRWEKPSTGNQPVFNQNKQDIVIHEADVYPDLLYTSAYADVHYLKYNSGPALANLMMAINKVIDAYLARSKKPKNEAALPPSSSSGELSTGDNYDPPAGPEKGLVHGITTFHPYRKKQKRLGNGQPHQLGYEEEDNDTENGLVHGITTFHQYPNEKPKELPQGSRYDLVKAPNYGVPATITNQPPVPSEPGVTPVNPGNTTTTTTTIPAKPNDSGSNAAYTVTVYGDKLRLIDTQAEGSGGSIKIIHKISKNLSRRAEADNYDNTERIWAEVRLGIGTVIKIKFEEFEEAGKDPRFAGNLLAQILPTVEVVLTPEPNSSFSTKNVEDKLVDLIKSTNITLAGKTAAETEAMFKAMITAAKDKGIDPKRLVSTQSEPKEEEPKPHK